MKKDPETQIIEQMQKMIEDLEANQIAVTPPQARISQFDKKIANAEWAKEETEFKVANAIENRTYWEARQAEGLGEVETAVSDLENYKKGKICFSFNQEPNVEIKATTNKTAHLLSSPRKY